MGVGRPSVRRFGRILIGSAEVVRVGVFLALSLWIGRIASVAHAAEPLASGPETPVAGADKEARHLFAEGQIRYSLGEYEAAIAAFRRAYELSSAPGLLFNIAQAHRLNGQCRQALEIYRHFIRLAPPSSEHQAEAERQVAILIPRCGTPALSVPTAPAPAPKVEVAAPAIVLTRPSQAEPERAPPGWSTRRQAAAGLLAGGIAAGVAAGILYGWNDGRYDNWRNEDRRLAASASGISGEEWLAAQERNEALFGSIQRTDTVNLVLAGVAVAAVLTAVVLVLFER